MRNIGLCGLFAFSVGLCQPVPNAGAAAEPVPGLLCMDRVSLEGRDLALGMSRDQVVLALDAGMKVIQKPKRYTAKKLAREADLIQQLTPMYPRVVEVARKAASDCGAECWIEIVSKKVGTDEIRVSMIGRERADMRVYGIVFDKGGSAIRAWRTQFRADLQHNATYFVTDDGTYRVARHGMTYVIDRVPQ